MVKVCTSSIRFEPYYLKGMQMIQKQRGKLGLVKVTRTSIIKEGLDAVFEQHGITQENIAAEIQKDTDEH